MRLRHVTPNATVIPSVDGQPEKSPCMNIRVRPQSIPANVNRAPIRPSICRSEEAFLPRVVDTSDIETAIGSNAEGLTASNVNGRQTAATFGELPCVISLDDIHESGSGSVF